jgi:Tat protein translocase TatB subunit
MPSIGPLEVVAVAAIALIVFGPEKLPEIARTVGRTLSQLRRMADEVRDEFKDGLDFDVDDEDETTPGPAPRRDHPNVRAMESGTAPEPATRGPGDDAEPATRGPGDDAEPATRGPGDDAEPDEDFDPNYYIDADVGEADTGEAADEGAAPADAGTAGDRGDDERTSGQEPAREVTPEGPPTPDPDSRSGPPTRPRADTDRPPEQRAG